jgi:hypothetical protein
MDQSPLKRYDPPLKKGVKKINELQVTATYCFDKENLSDPDARFVDFGSSKILQI